MTKYGQYCPMARAVEVLGDRWTLLIVRDLMGGTHHFNELEHGLPGISRSLLAQRLKRLQREGVIVRETSTDRHEIQYHLTAAGWELYPIVESLTVWGAKWAFGDPESHELNPILLMWWMRGRVHLHLLPQHRVVVEFDFIEAKPRNLWLILQRDDVSVCMTHPGFETDIWVRADLSTLFQVWLGRVSFAEAERDDKLNLEARLDLVSAFPSWFALSPVVDIVQGISFPRVL